LLRNPQRHHESCGATSVVVVRDFHLAGGWRTRRGALHRLSTSSCLRILEIRVFLKVNILVIIRRGAAAEEAERLGGGDLVPGTGGDEDGVAGADGAGFLIYFHDASAF
jgi:hypothetical protein